MKNKEILTYIALIVVGIVLAQHMNVVVSESMEPTLYRGDVVVIDTKLNNINIGDIVIYHAHWFFQPVIHRVINRIIQIWAPYIL